jgi:hypothetical protein
MVEGKEVVHVGGCSEHASGQPPGWNGLFLASSCHFKHSVWYSSHLSCCILSGNRIAGSQTRLQARHPRQTRHFVWQLFDVFRRTCTEPSVLRGLGATELRWRVRWVAGAVCWYAGTAISLCTPVATPVVGFLPLAELLQLSVNASATQPCSTPLPCCLGHQLIAFQWVPHGFFCWLTGVYFRIGNVLGTAKR